MRDKVQQTILSITSAATWWPDDIFYRWHRKLLPVLELGACRRRRWRSGMIGKRRSHSCRAANSISLFDPTWIVRNSSVPTVIRTRKQSIGIARVGLQDFGPVLITCSPRSITGLIVAFEKLHWMKRSDAKMRLLNGIMIMMMGMVIRYDMIWYDMIIASRT